MLDCSPGRDLAATAVPYEAPGALGSNCYNRAPPVVLRDVAGVAVKGDHGSGVETCLKFGALPVVAEKAVKGGLLWGTSWRKWTCLLHVGRCRTLLKAVKGGLPVKREDLAAPRSQTMIWKTLSC